MHHAQVLISTKSTLNRDEQVRSSTELDLFLFAVRLLAAKEITAVIGIRQCSSSYQLISTKPSKPLYLVIELTPILYTPSDRLLAVIT